MSERVSEGGCDAHPGVISPSKWMAGWGHVGGEGPSPPFPSDPPSPSFNGKWISPGDQKMEVR